MATMMASPLQQQVVVVQQDEAPPEYGDVAPPQYEDVGEDVVMMAPTRGTDDDGFFPPSQLTEDGFQVASTSNTGTDGVELTTRIDPSTPEDQSAGEATANSQRTAEPNDEDSDAEQCEELCEVMELQKHFCVIGLPWLMLITGIILCVAGAGSTHSKHATEFSDAYSDHCKYGNLTKYEPCSIEWYEKTDGDGHDGSFKACDGFIPKYYYESHSGTCAKNTIYEYGACRCPDVLSNASVPNHGYDQYQACWFNQCNAPITFEEPQKSKAKANTQLAFGIVCIVISVLLGLLFGKSTWGLNDPDDDYITWKGYFFNILKCKACRGGLCQCVLCLLIPFGLMVAGVYIMGWIASDLIMEADRWSDSGAADECLYANDTEIIECVGDDGCDGFKQRDLYTNLLNVSCSEVWHVEEECHCDGEIVAVHPDDDVRTCWMYGCDDSDNGLRFTDPKEVRSEAEYWIRFAACVSGPGAFICFVHCVYRNCVKPLIKYCKNENESIE